MSHLTSGIVRLVACRCALEDLDGWEHAFDLTKCCWLTRPLECSFALVVASSLALPSRRIIPCLHNTTIVVMTSPLSPPWLRVFVQRVSVRLPRRYPFSFMFAP